jgi:hypothetical protein
MAVTIMFGLDFATLLTLIVVPVLYAVFFKVPYEENDRLVPDPATPGPQIGFTN